LDDVLKKAQGLEGKAKTTQQKLALARDSAEAVADVYEEFAKVMRTKIEEEAQKIFALLVWKESQFPKIELTPDYHLTVLDRWGAPARPELSAGERQLLSLSFIMALSKASNGSAPLVMDTPFGRLDSKPRENISEHLPQMVDQLVLFVTGEELHGKAREMLKPHIGREYTLQWDKSTGCTAIVAQTTTA
jgi:DNA sulfur modification protein DndD